MKKYMAGLLALLLILTLPACAQKHEEDDWQSQYDLGVRHLEHAENDCIQAADAFKAAIEIAPERVEAYAKAAKAYKGIGDLESAIEILERGYSATGQESLHEEAVRLCGEKLQDKKDAAEDVDKDITDRGTGAVDSAALSGSSVPPVSSNSVQVSASDLGIDPETFGRYYQLVNGTGTLRMRAQPGTDFEIVGLIPEGGSLFALIREENGWAYGVCAGQLGWCSMEYLEPYPEDWGQPRVKVPDFLTWEQKILYLRANEMYTRIYWSGDMGDTNSTPLIRNDAAGNSIYYYETKYFNGSYDTYTDTVHEIFTGQPAEDFFINLGNDVEEINGKMYARQWDGGNILGVELQDYSFRLANQTEERIEFMVTGQYFRNLSQDGGGNHYTKEWPIVMERCEDGQWRVSRMASPDLGNRGFDED